MAIFSLAGTILSQQWDCCQHTCPVCFQPIQSARLGQRFQRLLVHMSWIDPLGEIIEILELATLIANSHDMFHRLNANALDGAKRVDDPIPIHVEIRL